MKFKQILLFLSLFAGLFVSVYAVPWYVDTTDYQVSSDIVREFLDYISKNARYDNEGQIIFQQKDYDEFGIFNDGTAYTTMPLILEHPEPYAVYYKWQGPNKPKIDYIDPNNDQLFCKYTIDYNTKKNAYKNIPKIAPKLPSVKIGIIKVAKKDIPYKPVAEYPYRQNYWAGARNACVANGMRLPTPQELMQIYNNRNLLGISFAEKPYWTSEERCACVSTTLDFGGTNLHTSKEIDFSECSPELKQMVKKGLVKPRVNFSEFIEVDEVGLNKGKTTDAKVRCVR